jgi:hypothetical protein
MDTGVAVEDESAKRLKTGDEQPVTPDDSMLDARSPKTPRLESSPRQQMMNQVTSTDLSLYEHEDEAVCPHFEQDDLDKLGQYELEFYDDEWLVHDDSFECDSLDIKNALKELSYPFSSSEPEVSEDGLKRLDMLADQVELHRLSKLSVLQDPNNIPADSKVLSTRFVRTWRERRAEDGSQIWLRRSRFVAREFAWLQPERESLFSPASGSIISRVLPTLFLQMCEHSNSVFSSA